MQLLVCLVGIPGSGKTTLSQQLQLGYHGIDDGTWIWINQDTLGDREACKIAARRALLDGKNVIIDRCNFDERQRSIWLTLASGPGLRRVQQRFNHPTLSPDEGERVCQRMFRDFVIVQRSEGFHQVMTAHNSDEIPGIMSQLVDLASFSARANSPEPSINGLHHGRILEGTSFGSRQYFPKQDKANQAHSFGLRGDYHYLAHGGVPGIAGDTMSHVQISPHQTAEHSRGSWPAQIGLEGLPPVIQNPHVPPAQGMEGWQSGRYQVGRMHHHGREQGMSGDPPLAEAINMFADPNCQVPYDDLPAESASMSSDAPASLRDLGPDNRIILLFDLNGTLTSHTSKRYSSGINRVRPKIEMLLQLKSQFRIGIYTSATVRTVATVRTMLEEAAGEPLFEPRLVLYRNHTVPLEDSRPGSKKWDTAKPLSKWFRRLNRVVLFDDDAHKALPGEELNFVQVPCWDDTDDNDDLIRELVEAAKQILGPLDAAADVRHHTSTITNHLMRNVEPAMNSNESTIIASTEKAIQM